MTIEPETNQPEPAPPEAGWASAALEMARSANRPLRLREFLAAGIHQQYVSILEARGDLVRVSRGTYRVASGEAGQGPWSFLASVSLRWPGAVVCGPTAAAYYGLLPPGPGDAPVWLAVGRGRGRPRGIVAGRPVQVREWVPGRLGPLGGVVEVEIDGVAVRIVDPEVAVAELSEIGDRAGRGAAAAAAAALAARGSRTHAGNA